MSACTRFPDDAQVLRYVTSDLAEPELSAFEDHLFDCDACLARVERYQAAQAALARRDLPAGPVGVVLPVDDPLVPARRLPWWLGAVAALLVLGLTGLLVSRQAPVPRATPPVVTPDMPGGTAALGPTIPASRPDTLGLTALALVTPPPYLPVTTRGTAGTDFEAAMEAYVGQDWAVASGRLAGLDTAEAHFYKGIADLMRGDSTEATVALEAVRASGRQPYARESAFYLGKAALLRGDRAAAREMLDAAVASRATTAGEARRVLQALEQAR